MPSMYYSVIFHIKAYPLKNSSGK